MLLEDWMDTAVRCYVRTVYYLATESKNSDTNSSINITQSNTGKKYLTSIDSKNKDLRSQTTYRYKLHTKDRCETFIISALDLIEFTCWISITTEQYCAVKQLCGPRLTLALNMG